MSTPPLVWLAGDALDTLGWRGSALRERIRTLAAASRDAATAGGRRPAAAVPRTDRAAEPAWLARWRRLYAPAGPEAFGRRLGWDGLDEASIGQLATCRPARPGWVDWLARIERAATRFAGGARLLVGRPSDPGDAAGGAVPFAAAWAPVVAAAREALSARSPRLSSILTPDAIGALERALLADLSSAAELALYAAFSERRQVEAGTPGDDEAGCLRHDRFVEGLLSSGWADIWRRYPVVARRTAVIADQWVASTADLIDRLEADADLLGATFGRDASRVSDLRPRLSDPHDGGRRVIGLRFTSGLRLAYKPRNISVDAAFHRLLGWLAEAGLSVAPPHLTVLDRDRYGWMEWAETDEFETTDQVRDYYRRAGSLLCLAHLLGASDLHGENIVATRSGPALVDAEALLQPLTVALEASPSDRRSCLRTGLLSLVHVDGAGQPYDVGGLRPAQPRTAAIGRRRWRDLGTDRIAFDLETLVWPPSPNAVSLDGRVFGPDDCPDEIVEGFDAAWALVASRRAELLAPGGPVEAFTDARVRVLFRPSDQYDSLLHLLDAPEWQGDAMDRSVALDSLNRVLVRASETPRLWPLVADEQEALERGDLPRFTVRAADTAITSGAGSRIAGHYAVSGHQAAVDRIKSATADELAWQRDQVESVLRPDGEATARTSHSTRRAPPAADTPPVKRLASAAETIGHEILSRARRLDSGALTWRGMTDRLDLYGGQAGPAVALAALAVGSPEPRWTEGWRLAAAPLVEAADDAASTGDWRRYWHSLGAASGVASAVFSLAWLGRATGDLGLLGRAVSLAGAIGESEIAAAGDADLERGLAGLVLVLVGLHGSTRDARVLSLAERAADRLLALAVEPAPGQLAWPSATGDRPTGLGHGTAGIALALARLAAVTSEAARSTTLREAARAARRFESGQFSSTEGNWPASRPDGGTVMMLGWCHGAPGVGMARLLTAVALGESGEDAEAEAALRTSARAPSSRFDHVCCGNLARSEALVTAGRITGRGWAAQAGTAIAIEVADRVLAGGGAAARTSGLETGQLDVGFFQGLSGILYQLARAADPRRLPSVLAFELPGGDA